jgi:hypothetical protein
MRFEIGKMYRYRSEKPSVRGSFKLGDTVVLLHFVCPLHIGKINVWYGSGDFEVLTEQGEVLKEMLWYDSWEQV